MDRKAWIKSARPVGRAGHSNELIDAMRKDYTDTGSVAKTAKLWGITRQACWDILQRRRLTRSKTPPTEVIEHGGRRFVPDKDGYLRCTSFDSRKPGRLRLLHRIVWNELHGAVPAGFIIAFKDGNRINCSPENLYLITRSEFRKRVPTGNGWTKYRAKYAELEQQWLSALARSAPAEEVQELKSAMEALPKPKGRDPAAYGQLMRQIWASYTPEQRAARIEKSHVKRRRSKSLGHSISVAQTLNHAARLAA